jgi:hypothetical protein
MTKPLGALDARARVIIVALLALVLAAVALPTLAANPDTGPGQGNGDRAGEPLNADASDAPGNSGNAKAKKAKKAKVPTEPITIRGEVTAATDADGDPVYRMTSGGTTYDLEAGPRWFHGEDHPLKGFVGDTVTIVGEIAEGSTEVDVESVNGTALRAPGKPPWAGGWKVVGERHPGWSQEKADRMADKAERMKDKFGDCFPPGKCKQDAAAE